MHAPCVHAARLPKTRRGDGSKVRGRKDRCDKMDLSKQWKSGGTLPIVQHQLGRSPARFGGRTENIDFGEVNTSPYR